jgi:hypothetical protein
VDSRTRRRLAWLTCLGSVAATVAAIPLAAHGRVGVSWAVVTVLPVLGCSTVGAILVVRVPGNAIGGLYLGIGVALALSMLADAYVAPALSAPGRPAAATVANVSSGLPLVALPVLLLLFPDGRLPSPRWRPVALVWAIAAAAVVVGFLFAPSTLGLPSDPSLRNPTALGGVAGTAAQTVAAAGVVVVLGSIVAAAAAMVVRFRRASGDTRQQLKWFGAAATVVGLVALATPVLWSMSTLWSVYVSNALWAVSSTGLVAATGVAILRYRLYEIDTIIRRTLVYTALVTALAAVYLAGIGITDVAFRLVTGQSGTIAVTLSTLAVALAFQPLRRRIQRLVERRFYRRAYDAAATLSAFSGRLREHVDLASLDHEILTVVQHTFQPRFAGMWLRETGARPAVPLPRAPADR